MNGNPVGHGPRDASALAKHGSLIQGTGRRLHIDETPLAPLDLVSRQVEDGFHGRAARHLSQHIHHALELAVINGLILDSRSPGADFRQGNKIPPYPFGVNPGEVDGARSFRPGEPEYDPYGCSLERNLCGACCLATEGEPHRAGYLIRGDAIQRGLLLVYLEDVFRLV